jgi:mRNA interferase RelE/StbE
MKSVLIPRDAYKALRKLPEPVQATVRSKLERYAAIGAGDVRPLAGRDGARLRVGDYRVIFVETDTDIHVIRIGHRKDVYE